MRKLIFVFLASLTVQFVFGNACDCDNDNWSKVIGNIGYYNFSQDVEDHKSAQDCNGSASNHRITEYNVDGTWLPIGGLYSSVYGNWTSWISGNTPANFNLETFTEFFNTSNAGGSLGNHYQKVTLKFKATIDPSFNILCGSQTGNGITYQYTVLVTIYIGGDIFSNVSNVVCSDRDYVFSELIGNYSASNIYFNEEIGNNNGEVFNGNVITFTAPPSGSFEMYWKGTVSGAGVEVLRKWIKTVYVAGTISFNQTGFPNQFNSTDSDYNISNLCTFTLGTGYGYEAYPSNGIYQSVPNWYFSPSISGPGTQTLKVRSTHYGCYSAWKDTSIYVYPVVTTFVTPSIDLSTTFGSGEIGINAKQDFPTTYSGTFPNTQVYPAGTATLGKFHFVCENTSYYLQVSNAQSNVFYDWFSLRNGILDTLGSGLSKLILTVTDPDLNESQSLVNNPFVNNNNNVPFYVQGTTGKTVYVGDLTTIMVRPRNVINQVGNFTKVYFGVVDKPEINEFNSVCFDQSQGLNLVVNSTNPTYLSYLTIPEIRTGRWNVDADPFWEVIGDTVVFSTGNSNKYNYYQGQAVDTTKMYMWNNGVWNVTVEPQADISCYSTIETIPIVIKAMPSASFNVIGNVGVGTPVLGIVSGTYMNVDIDSIVWHWSDDANYWNNDTCWHYLNDLGTVSLTVEVIDTFGCIGSVTYSNNWTLSGFLETLDLAQSNHIPAYPNPSEGIINIDADNGDHIVVYDQNGRMLLNKIIDNKTINLSPYKGKLYVMNLTKKIYEIIVII